MPRSKLANRESRVLSLDEGATEERRRPLVRLPSLKKEALCKREWEEFELK
jgi:hypothetical protein